MSNNLFQDLRDIAKALGISSNGKSTTQLGALIKAATNNLLASAPSLINPNALSKHFEEGRFTDCTIRVKIRDGRPAKRLKSERDNDPGSEVNAAVGAEADDVRVIKAHAVILASRSAYFERAMGGEWRESQDRSFEVEVEDETEYVTFRRLIKLCYGSTFIKEGDRDLDVSELVRLIHVANAFECMDAVKQCATALTNGDLDLEGAVQCLELTEMLKGVEGMDDLAEEAGEVLAKEVGPVDELFTPAQGERDGGDVLGGLRLSEKVAGMSPAVFETLLTSEGLQFELENERFWLLLAWVEAQSEESEEGKQALFESMIKYVSLKGMDPGYIVLMVSEHPRIIAAGLQKKVLTDSLVRANQARRSKEDSNGYLGPFLGGWRAPRPPVMWTLEVSFNAVEALALQPGEECRKVVGLVAGMPWYVELYRTAVYDETGEAEVYTNCSLPFEWTNLEDGGGFYFKYNIEVGVGAPRECNIEEGDLLRRCWPADGMWGDMFAPWADIFREGNDWLVDGELHMRLTVKATNDQGPSVLKGV